MLCTRGLHDRPCSLFGPHNISVHNTARIHSPSGTPFVMDGYAIQSTEHEAELTLYYAGHGTADCLYLRLQASTG